jgi:hypothetical protein
VKKIETFFDVQNGIKFWYKLPEYKDQLEKLPDGRYTQSTEKVEHQQSREQNNARWAIPYMFMMKALKESGNISQDASKKECHEFCMVNWLPADYRERIYEEWKNKPFIINMKTGEKYKEPFRLTTTRMTTRDSNNYYENMQNGYAENFSSGEPDDQIPDPDKNWKNKNKNAELPYPNNE